MFPLSDYIRPTQSTGVLIQPLALRGTLTPRPRVVLGTRGEKAQKQVVPVFQPALTRASGMCSAVGIVGAK